MRYRLHVPTERYEPCPSRLSLTGAFLAARMLARSRLRPVHIIDTRPGGGLVTVIHPPGTWDRA